jgi:hypothetical protein
LDQEALAELRRAHIRIYYRQVQAFLPVTVLLVL